MNIWQQIDCIKELKQEGKIDVEQDITKERVEQGFRSVDTVVASITGDLQFESRLLSHDAI